MRLSNLILFVAVVSLRLIALETAYVKFDHPEGWKCELVEGVWICQSTLDPDRKESLVMSIAALASDWDTIDNFETYLKQPRTIKNDADQMLASEISYTRKRNLNGHVWVDSLQHNSELPGFWTRYLATVNQRLAILITYIVSDEHYSKLAPQFERMVISLTLVNQKGGVPSVQGDNPLPGPERLGPSLDLLKSRLNIKKSKQESPSTPVALIAIGIVILAAVIVLGRRRKKPVSAHTKPREPNPPR